MVVGCCGEVALCGLIVVSPVNCHQPNGVVTDVIIWSHRKISKLSGICACPIYICALCICSWLNIGVIFPDY